MAPAPSEIPRIVGRYAVFGRIASGGMASVELGRRIGAAGFSRVVALKRMHPELARDPEFVAMFLDEARLAARVRHPNVGASTDVVAEAGELFIVMEYVEGEALSNLLRLAEDARTRPAPDVLVGIVVQALHGLHAAHEAKGEDGQPLGIVHRDVSPQNILVGTDGLVRVVDFGIARAAGRAQELTQDGVLKGKIAYMAPEQIRREPLDRRADVYAAAVVLWEALTGTRLFKAATPLQTIDAVLRGGAVAPSRIDPSLPTSLDAVIATALAIERDARYASALAFADALEAALRVASHRVVGRWVEGVASAPLASRARLVAAIEAAPATGDDARVGPAKPPLAAPAAPPPAAPAAPPSFVPSEPTDVKPAPEIRSLAVGRIVVPADLDLDAPTIEETESLPRPGLDAPTAPSTYGGPPVGGGAEPTLEPLRPIPRSASATSAHRSTFVLVAFACSLVVFAIGALVFRLARSAEAIATTNPVSPEIASPHPSTRPALDSHPATSALPDVAPSARSIAEAPSASSPGTASSSGAAASSAANASSAPRALPSDRCSPPYYYDERHLKRFKPGCVR